MYLLSMIFYKSIDKTQAGEKEELGTLCLLFLADIDLIFLKRMINYYNHETILIKASVYYVILKVLILQK